LALLAAYAFALQAVLPFALAAVAGADVPHCSTASGATSGPVDDQNHTNGGTCPCCSACGALCGVHALSEVPPAAVAIVRRASAIGFSHAPQYREPARYRGPQIARAPPAV
jgi:hypothetical protein